MAYDEGLAERIRGLLEEQAVVTEKRMFGGLAFLVGGHMCVGIVKDSLMVRVGAEAYQRALSEPHVREMDFTGRPMNGLVFVMPAGYQEDSDLARWVGAGLAHVGALPPKPAPGGQARRPRR